MSQFYQQPEDNRYPQYPQFDFPSPENQQPTGDFAPTQGEYSPENQQPSGGFAPMQGEYSPLVNRQPTGSFAPMPENQQPTGSFAPAQGEYSPENQQPSGGFAPMQGRYSPLVNRQPTGGFAPVQGEYVPENQQPTGGFASMQGEYAPENQQPTGGFAPMQGGYSPLVNRQPNQGGYSPLVNRQPTGGFAPGQRKFSLLGNQQPTGGLVSEQKKNSLLGNRQPKGGFVPGQGGYLLSDNRQPAGTVAPGQGGYLLSGNRQSARSFLASTFQLLLEKFTAKRTSAAAASAISGPRPFDVTVVAIVVTSIGGLNLFLFLISLCSLSVVSSLMQPLYSTPYTGSLAAQLSAAVGLNTLMFVVFYYTALGIGHLYIARGLWQLKSWAYWSVLTIEGLTIFIQIIVFLVNHNGGAFFANVYIPILIAGYLLVASEVRRTFQVPF